MAVGVFEDKPSLWQALFINYVNCKIIYLYKNYVTHSIVYFSSNSI